jgi:hypothetical protein
MLIQIGMNGPAAGDELGSLYTWLREEPEIRRHARMSMITAKPNSGEMAAAFETIQLVVDSSFQALNLALAYAAWRTTRPMDPKLTIEHGSTKVTIEDADPDIVETIIQALK